MAYVATKRGGIITAAIVADLAALAFFKYTNFFAETSRHSACRSGRSRIVLPLGISFFTFHHIMYLVDLRRGKAPNIRSAAMRSTSRFFRRRSPGRWRAGREVMHQFGQQVYAPGWQRQFALGITFIAMGLFEKTFLADPLGRMIDPIYAQAMLVRCRTGRLAGAELQLPDPV